MRLKLFTAWMLVIATAPIAATDAPAAGEGLRDYRVDASMFLYSFGQETYGPWWGARTRLTTERPGEPTGVLELVGERHGDRGHQVTGSYLTGGLYKDWTERVFTASFVGAGSGLPFARFSTHHEMRIKLLESKEVVFGAGGGYVDFDDDNQAGYFSLGTTYFWHGIFDSDPVVVLQYQYRQYYADPVAETAPMQIMSVSALGPGGSTILQYVRGSGDYVIDDVGSTSFRADVSGQAINIGHSRKMTASYGVTVKFEFIERRDETAEQSLFHGIGTEVGIFRVF
jgi:YaiO family outer membrane protein